MDIIARIGGDEFVVFIQDSHENNTENIAARLTEGIEACNRERKGYKLSISAGVARLDPRLDSVEDLLRRADQLMYKQKKAKSSGS